MNSMTIFTLRNLVEAFERGQSRGRDSFVGGSTVEQFTEADMVRAFELGFEFGERSVVDGVVVGTGERRT